MTPSESNSESGIAFQGISIRGLGEPTIGSGFAAPVCKGFVCVWYSLRLSNESQHQPFRQKHSLECCRHARC